MQFRTPPRGNYREHQPQHQAAAQPAAMPVAPAQTALHPRKSRSMKISGGKLMMIIVVLLLLAVAAGAAVFYNNRYQQTKKEVKRLSNPQQVAKDQTQQLLENVGKLTVLPKGENPTVATVTDLNKLKDQPFFANAQNGDKVLIYTQAKKAFLYRPSTNKIINIAPVI